MTALLQRVLVCYLGIVTSSAAEWNSASVQSADLKRAKQRVPRAAWKGSNFAGMNRLLTSHLSQRGHTIRPCAEWTVGDLQQLHRRLFNESENELLAIYEAAVDNRRQRFKTLSALEEHWAKLDAAASLVEGLDTVQRDGLCHETVMSAVHHLSSSSLRRIREEHYALPSLPVHRHEWRPTNIFPLTSDAMAQQKIHGEYETQVSCQQCHTGTIKDPDWQDASLPKPNMHENKEMQRLERLRTCDYQADPPCGPCEGMGGVRWGEGLHEFTPIPCTIIHGPEKPASTTGRYPELGTATLTGETRSPVEVRPKPGENVTYSPMHGNISVDYRGAVMFRQRYDFEGMGIEISVQTYDEAKNMDTGATIFGGGSFCQCGRSIAGLFHRDSFDPADPLDPLKLPANKGGAAYLGRVQVTLENETYVADHFMKWAFHFLINADENSSSFGLPLQLYGPMGVRQVFHNWQLVDPEIARPEIWHLPKGCTVTASSCSLFPPAGRDTIVV